MMNANALTDSCLATRNGIARPFYFNSGDKHLFAWLHQPATPLVSQVGVVICNPFGYESICAHRSVREFAEAISALGIPALRFDYLGTGDSAEIDENADQLKLWSRDVIAAIRELHHRTGVDRICLLGVRLGALLATLAAAECSMVESLILVGPVVSGRRYLRELRMAQLAGIAMTGSGGSDGDPEANRTNPKGLEAGGFSLSAATLQSLAIVDLQSTAAPAVRSILILDNDKLPSAKRWAESLQHSGIQLEYQNLPGLVEMAMTAPQFATVPRPMIDATRRWLTTIAKSTEADPTADRSPTDRWATNRESSMAAALPLSGDQESPQTSITERPVFISAGVTLFGIITEPRPDEKRHRAASLPICNPEALCVDKVVRGTRTQVQGSITIGIPHTYPCYFLRPLPHSIHHPSLICHLSLCYPSNSMTEECSCEVDGWNFVGMTDGWSGVGYSADNRSRAWIDGHGLMHHTKTL